MTEAASPPGPSTGGPGCDRPVRFGILSFEHQHGWSYAATLSGGALPGVELTAVFDADRERLERAARDYPAVPGFHRTAAELLRRGDIDAVVICSANSDHEALALAAIAAGKHVLCEKPLALTVEGCDRMIDAARAAGVRMMTAFPVRFSPAIREAKRLIASGALGRVLAADTTNHGTMPGRWFVDAALSGGGAVIDHTVHVVDLLRWLLDDEIADIRCEHATRLHPELEVEDVGLLLMRWRKGTVATLDTSWSRPKSFPIWGNVHLRLKGESANLDVDCFPRQTEHSDIATMRNTGGSPGENLDEAMLAEFVASIREGRDPLVTGEDGKHAVEAAVAAYRSAAASSASQPMLAV